MLFLLLCHPNCCVPHTGFIVSGLGVRRMQSGAAPTTADIQSESEIHLLVQRDWGMDSYCSYAATGYPAIRALLWSTNLSWNEPFQGSLSYPPSFSKPAVSFNLVFLYILFSLPRRLLPVISHPSDLSLHVPFPDTSSLHSFLATPVPITSSTFLSQNVSQVMILFFLSLSLSPSILSPSLCSSQFTTQNTRMNVMLL